MTAEKTGEPVRRCAPRQAKADCGVIHAMHKCAPPDHAQVIGLKTVVHALEAGGAGGTAGDAAGSTGLPPLPALGDGGPSQFESDFKRAYFTTLTDLR
ncbi:hypothetical protein DIPPA_32433 [Diplonema papillatum]|nr:hypothetical protein DIPPA_32433 [Diplonema papillatum]